MDSSKRAVWLKELLSGEETYNKLRDRAGAEGLADCSVRSVCWRVFLGALSPTEDPDVWRKECDDWRAEYNKLKQEYIIDPHEHEPTTKEELETNNPLAQSEDSPWAKFFEHQEVQKQIAQDVERTYPENEFFQLEETKTWMLNILFIYARTHPEVEYKQGMHELLAPMLYLMHKEINGCFVLRSGQLRTSPSPHEVVVEEEEEEGLLELGEYLMSPKHIEHDAYATFKALMEMCGPWFVYKPMERRVSIRQELLLPDDDPDADANSGISPIVIKCRKIQQVLLQRHDPDLYEHFEALQIEPQLYLLRWVRLLFGREFHLEDLMVLWDGIFAYGKWLELVEYVCVSMLMYIRTQLLEMDYNGCLRRLFKYPPVEEISLFVDRASDLANPKPKPKKPLPKSVVGALPSAPATSAAADDIFSDLPVDSAGKVQVRAQPKLKPKPKQQASSVPSVRETINRMLEDPAEAALKRANDRMKELLKMQQHMAQRLERITYVIQSALVQDSGPGEDDLDNMLLSLAELKQVRDILSGDLPPDVPFHSPLDKAVKTGGEVSSPPPMRMFRADSSDPPIQVQPDDKENWDKHLDADVKERDATVIEGLGQSVGGQDETPADPPEGEGGGLSSADIRRMEEEKKERDRLRAIKQEEERLRRIERERDERDERERIEREERERLAKEEEARKAAIAAQQEELWADLIPAGEKKDDSLSEKSNRSVKSTSKSASASKKAPPSNAFDGIDIAGDSFDDPFAALLVTPKKVDAKSTSKQRQGQAAPPSTSAKEEFDDLFSAI